MKILISPDPFLKIVAKPVEKLDKKLRDQIEEMTKVLRAAQDPEGVGLAATQVGINKRLLILNLHNQIEVIINPKILKTSEAKLSEIYTKKKDRWLEGCLSLPRIWGFVDRPFWVEMEYQTIKSDQLVLKTRKFEGVESSYALHEYDHLDGILFTDRILEQKGTIYQETEHGLSPIDLI